MAVLVRDNCLSVWLSLIRVDVPPAHIGHNKHYGKDRADTYAALIEWFYDDKKEGYISGGRIMMGLIEDFDLKKGEKHNFETILDGLGNNENILEYWAEVLTFDTITGNLDRHQDNWGIVFERNEERTPTSMVMSPAFDNGTALGHEILEENMDKFEDTDTAQRYLTGRYAKHHMKWSLDEKGQPNFYEFMNKFTIAFPQIRPIIAQKLSFTCEQVKEVLAPLVDAVSVPEYKLTRKRLDFVMKLIFARKRILKETLEL